MNTDNETDETQKNIDKNSSRTPSIAKLKRMIGPSPAPRMLTPSKIVLLRQSKKEMAQVAHEILASKDNTSRK